MLKPLSLLHLFLTLVIALAGCTSINQTIQPTQSAIAPTIGSTTILTPVTTETMPSTPTRIGRLPSNKPSPTITLVPLDTLEPAQATETMAHLINEPINCAVPCFWGIAPGKTRFEEAKILFGKLGLIPFEGIDPNSGKYFYTISYDSGTGFDSSVTLLINDDNFVESIEVTPDIPQPKGGRPREWIAYSPETLIKRYGSPSRVDFAVGSQQNVSINMIMYFDTFDLIVWYSGINMTPKSFCPLIDPFDFVRLWIGHDPPDIPTFETIPLEKATSLTIDQFAKLMKGDPKKACFTLTSDGH